jgi:hypothetical protein
MFGQVNHNGHRYYRHAHVERDRKCPLTPRPWVRADYIEEEVVRELFQMFGNPAAIERAVKAAVPDCEAEMERKARLEKDVEGIEASRQRVLGLVVKGLINDTQAEKQLRDLNDREATLRVELDKVAAVLADVPDPEALRCYVEKVEDMIFVFDDNGEQVAGGNDVQSYLLMNRDDKRNMIRAVFDTPLADGSPAGVYISPDPATARGRSKRWSFKIRGRLDFEAVVSRARD